MDLKPEKVFKNCNIFFPVVHLLLLAGLVVAPIDAVNAGAIDRDEFYSPPTEFQCTMDVVDDFNANEAAREMQSRRFQQAIDAAADCEGSARLTVPAGNYFLKGIKLKSNVHIRVNQGAVFLPSRRTRDPSNSIFELGIDLDATLRNVSIIGGGTGFKVDLRAGGAKEFAVDVGDVDGFALENFKIIDEKTIFSSIILNINTRPGRLGFGKNGRIVNIHQEGANIGYGLIQTQGAQHVLFDNISSEGGVALRIETDDRRMRQLGVGGVDDINAIDVGCIDGLAAVMLSPHFMANGSVTVEGVQADSCAYAVRAEPGFTEFFGREDQTKDEVERIAVNRIGRGSIARIYSRNNGKVYVARFKPSFADKVFEELGIRPGAFGTVKISDIVSKYGTTSQYKGPAHRYLSCTEQYNDVCIDEPDRENNEDDDEPEDEDEDEDSGNQFRGPNVAAVSDKARTGVAGGYEITTTNVMAVNYPEQEVRRFITVGLMRNICPRRLELSACGD